LTDSGGDSVRRYARAVSALRERRGTDVNIRSGPQWREYEAIVERIARDRPRRVLDWGCGWGQVTALLVGAGLDVSAFDYRPEVPREGMRPLPRFPEIEAYISHDPIHLPFEDGSFDAVLSCGVLEHVEDPDASLEELMRVLEPGGTMYVYKLPNRYSYLEWIARLLGLYYHGEASHDAVYTKRSAVSLLERHGFVVREARRTNVLPLTLSGRAATRFAGVIWRANRALMHVPGLNSIATNIEVIATAPP
jgi:ubiquinone/menaquinone biosynthesis C-methylase UbiE